jgi:hypothetical protein
MVVGLAWLLIIFVTVMLMATAAEPHEGKGYRHATGTIGPIIYVSRCEAGVQVWGLDKNMDGQIDQCKAVIFNHGKLHVRDAAVSSDGKGCSCD